MALRKFQLAFSSIATVPFYLFVALIIRYKVDPRYYFRCLVALVISIFFGPFMWFEHLRFDRKLARVQLPASPVFIVGHWRSGTTLLHNVMCRDQQFAYVNTYQSVFTNQFFGSRWFFRPLMRWLMPEKRPADNVRLDPDFPQEEGIALCNAHSFAFYLFFYFPQRWKQLYHRYISGKDSSPKQIEAYKSRYKRLIAQSIVEYGRKNFVSKSPPNTGMIKYLLEMFPAAKFIYIYRDPVKVHKSTVNFFDVTTEALTLQKYTRNDMEEMVFSLYEMLIKDYEATKSIIPAQHLVEIKYEDFEKDPLEGIRAIYEKLNLEGFEYSRDQFIAYLDEQKKFEKGNYPYQQDESAYIASRLEFAMKMYGYDKPGKS